MSQVYLSLGTNLGDRRANLQEALGMLRGAMKITAVSPLYQTDPWGVADQPEFLNICIAATTNLSPQYLLFYIKAIETELGREDGPRWGPRLIDIDILFYDDLVVEDEKLTIPHLHLTERAFVLAPLADIAPDLIHPQTAVSVQTLLSKVEPTAVTKIADTL